MKNNTFQEIGTELKKAQTVLIFPHIHVDADALGSAYALCLALRDLGKEAYVYMSEREPDNLDFLAGEYRIIDDYLREASLNAEAADPAKTMAKQLFPDGYDLAFMVDCSSMDRIKLREPVFELARRRAVLDHHATTKLDIDPAFGRIEPDSAATGELVFLLLKEMGANLSLEIANRLWAAITTDTGRYQHSNTTPRSHEIAAELHRVPGFDSKKISNLIYNRRSFESLKLESMMLDSIELYENGEIAIGIVSEEMQRESGADLTETEGFIEAITAINGVEIACLIKEPPAPVGVVRVSLRAKSYANVARVTELFGGGGHIRAAGGTFPKPIENAVSEIRNMLIDELRRSKAEL